MDKKLSFFAFLIAFFLLGTTQVFGAGGFLEPCNSGNTCNVNLVCQDGKICVFKGGQGPQSGGDVLLIIKNISNWVFAFMMALSVIFILMAAFEFIANGGEPAKVNEARQRLIWAAVGIVIALLANSFPTVIQKILE